MKRAYKLLIYICLVASGIYFWIKHAGTINAERNPHIGWSQQQSDDGDCPPEGSAKRDDLRELNVLKNRVQLPQLQDFDFHIQMSDLLKAGDDRGRWSNSKAVRVRAYISEVKPGGMETCNCKAKEPDARDTHIELVLNPMDGGALPVIAEITPRMRQKKSAQGIDWSTKHIRSAYQGRWVEIEGWLLFDKEHAAQAENTAPGRPRNWRATAWEIHPITAIKLATRPLK